MKCLDVQRGLRPGLLACEERGRRHLRRNRDAKHLQRRRRERGTLRKRRQADARRVVGHVEAVDEVQGVRGLRETRLVVDHLLGVAVVCVDEDVRVELEEPRQNLADALVRHLNRLRRRLRIARVADHVAVRVVDDDEAVGIVLETPQELVRHVVRLHLRMRGERRRVEARLDLDLVLTRRGRRGLAVEEARHVLDLLRLRKAELLEAGLRDDLAEEVVHAAARAHRAEEIVLELVPVAREAEERHLRLRGETRLVGIVRRDERLRQLDRAVLAVVRVHDDVAVLQAGIVADHVARDVLIRHGRIVRRLAVLILALHGLLDRRRGLAGAGDDAVVGLARQLVVLRAVHAVVAAHRRADYGVPDRCELGLEARDVLKRRARRRVAPGEERMHHNLPLGELGARALHQLEEVLLVGVGALVLQEPKEVELRVVLLPVRDEVLPLGRLEELTRRKTVVNALQLLHDDAPRAHVEVTDLGRALIAVRQPNRLAAAVQQTMRIARADLVDDGRLRLVHRIPLLARVHAPAIANNQNNRSHFLFISL